MISLNIDPILIGFGPLQIRYYGLVFVFGFIVALFVLLKAVKKGRLGLTKEKVYDLVFFLLIGIVVGARIFHILFWGLDYYFSDPIKMLYLWQGGLSFHGGLVGGIIAVYFFTKKNKIGFWRVADILTLPAIFMLGFGRIANFINQEILGTITELPWCVKFLRTDPLNCRHPVQLYAAVGKFSLFGFLARFSYNHKDGYVFWNFVFLTGIGRLLLDFLREDIKYLALKPGQWLSIVMILLGGFILYKFYKEDLKLSLGLKKITKDNQP